jgi:hypothetical protein
VRDLSLNCLIRIIDISAIASTSTRSAVSTIPFASGPESFQMADGLYVAA